MKRAEGNNKDFNLFYHLHKEKFPDDFRKDLDYFFEFYTFYHEVLEACSQRMVPLLDRLMLRHYPALEGAMHPVQLEYMKDLNETIPYGLLLQLRGLLREQAEGVNIPSKYPKIESWREFYGKPSQPSTVDDKYRSFHLFPNDADWEKEKEKENRLLRILHEWEQRRLKEYFDLVQPLLFEFMPQLNELEGDFWVLYAVAVRDSYEEWLSCCEHLETAVEYEMPPESVKWDDEEFRKVQFELYKANPRKLDEMRRERIYGEERM